MKITFNLEAVKEVLRPVLSILEPIAKACEAVIDIVNNKIIKTIKKIVSVYPIAGAHF